MAQAGDSEASQTSMTTDEAMEILGVKEGSGFEVILSAKNRLLRKAGNDKDKKTQVACIWPSLPSVLMH